MLIKKISLALATILSMVFVGGCSFMDTLFGEKNSASKIESLLEEEVIDFVVEAKRGRDPLVLQLTDPQIIDSSQQRTPDRLSPSERDYWTKDSKEERCYKYIRQIIQRSSPDLILITGDIVYGQFDDDGSCLTEFIAFMESFNIPWAPIWGNHEAETNLGVDWQCEQFEKAENCLFKQRTLTGNGNYSIGIKQGDNLLRVFYMLDSNGCASPSAKTLENKHFQSTSGFGADQIEWYQDSISALKKVYPEIKISFAFHIPMFAMYYAFAQEYGVDVENFSALDLDKVGHNGDMGYLGGAFSGWDKDMTVWADMKNLGVDSLLVGHYHENSASIMYDGIRIQFGQKSSAYDSINYRTEFGDIVFSSVEAGEAIVGGTLMQISRADGMLLPMIMLYEE